MKRNAMKASELVAAIQKRIAEEGDLEVSVNSQEGASYSLYGEDDVRAVEWTMPDGSKAKTIEIG